MNKTPAAGIARRIASWFEAAYVENCVDRPLDGVLEASRWGWLPALSGVAVAADSAAKQPATNQPA
ncbi:hypothetical protein V1638_10780 [Pseudarthrobacter sp. J64]|uniref:hypothetical protein n=1 Tax=Pseudarthrobacter sp. J64 TaxID=3116485 RepID=UPI002E81122E|nr:hypothetical protein [Pseudarthrobacter sp. J64]MEE2569878.1 hypothetical protein [Pseudarthrobacter sp. J64]